MYHIYRVLIITWVIGTILLSGCTTRQNTSATRNYQAFITRYNVHYNGDRHYNETLEDMERDYKDDFSRMLFVIPAEARAVPDAPQPDGDFSRSIEKARKAIQLHSIKNKPAGPSSSPQQREWKRRSEYNPFLHNSWLMLGRAQYMNGDFTSAANTFLYISLHFKWLPEIVAEARTWEALSYCALDRLHEAEITINHIDTTYINSNESHLAYLSAISSLKLRSGQYNDAATSLTELLKLCKGNRKARTRFLLAQTLEKCGRNDEAYQHYKKTCGNMRANQRIRFNARMAMSRITPQKERDRELSDLIRIARFESNRDYLDQIHHAIGNIYISQGDTTRAEAHYIDAISESTRNGAEQAIARLALGEIYYAKGKYYLASECYSLSLPMLPSYYPNLQRLQQRGTTLSRIAHFDAEIRLQDSLIVMSTLSLQEQKSLADRLAQDYTGKLHSHNSINRSPETDTGNNRGSWYFYNPKLIEDGKIKFKKRWGNRANVDNWRTSIDTSEHSFLLHEEVATQPYNTTHDNTEQNDDTVSLILAAIPDTPQRREIAEMKIADGLYNIGLILRNDFQDYNAAKKTWKELAARFPASKHIPEVLEGLYLMYARDGETENAEHIREIILSNLAGSTLAEEMKDPDFLDRRKELIASRQSIYEQAFAAYLNNDNKTVHEICDRMIYKDAASPLTPHFQYINALAYAADGERELFGNEMKTLANNHNGIDLSAIARGMLKHLGNGRVPYSGNGNVHPLRRSFALDNTDDSDEPFTTVCDTLFTIRAESPHIVLIAFDNDSVNANIMLFQIARHNFNTFAVKDFSLDKCDLADAAAIRIGGFANASEADRYVTLLEKSRNSISAIITPLVISIEDFSVLCKYRLSISTYLKAIERHRYNEVASGVSSTPDT